MIRDLASTFETAADAHGLGFIRLDVDGQAEEISVTARTIVRRFFELHTTPPLPREISEWLGRDRHRDNRSELVLYRRDGRSLIVHRAPTASGDLLVLSEEPNAAFDAGKVGLTAREAEVLALVREGLATKRIASALGISPRTVDKHIQRALDKLASAPESRRLRCSISNRRLAVVPVRA